MSNDGRDEKPITNPADLKAFIVSELEKAIFLISDYNFNRKYNEAFWCLYDILIPNLPPDILEKPVIAKRDKEADMIITELNKLTDIDPTKSTIKKVNYTSSQHFWIRATIRDVQKELYNYMRTGYRGIDLDKTLSEDTGGGQEE